MFRVPQVLLRIRFWTHRSVLLDTDPDPDPDPALSSVTFKMLPSFFAYYLPKVYSLYLQYFKDSKLLGSHKVVEIKVFPNFLLVDDRPGSTLRSLKQNYRSGSVRAKKRMNPTDLDPDPERWLVLHIRCFKTYSKMKMSKKTH